MAQEVIRWTAPSPIWPQAIGNPNLLSRQRELRQPTILRFATDDFMDQFLNLLGSDPSRLRDLIAIPETWRGALPEPEPIVPVPAFARKLQRLGLIASRNRDASPLPTAASVSKGPLKLYQPAHQRYYLVASCLVCGQAGLPDKAIATAREQRVSFVVRRLMPTSTSDNFQAPINSENLDEYAFVAGPGGAGWKRITSRNLLESGEEQLPLFAVHLDEDDGRQRRVFAGLIPVARREAYINAMQMPPTQAGTLTAASSPLDPRMALVRSQVIEPWKHLIEIAETAVKVLGSSGSITDAEKTALLKSPREQIQTGSWYVLLDLAKFLEDHIGNVWERLQGKALSIRLTDKQQDLIGKLQSITLTQYPNTSLESALKSIRLSEDDLEQVEYSYDSSKQQELWPNFLFPLADPEIRGPLSAQDVDGLDKLIAAALPAESTGEAPAIPLAARPVMDTRQGWFVIRCVFERPECGPLDPPLLSDPTVPFQMAGFFDPDAPARPIRIALPIDTTPAGLRKFDKNTAFMISDVLCGQIKRVRGMSLGDLIRSVLPWPFYKPLSVPDTGPCGDNAGRLGMICSLSLPIITICALLLLMMIVALLDAIFRWIPFFLICFPLPGFKSKD